MRAGGYTVHQSLTAEAAAVLEMAVGLARRRGHAQVTPLHVAFTLLSSSSSPLPDAFGLLRRACVKSQHSVGAVTSCSPAASPHPPQCRALELCFNVALNRLATIDVRMAGPEFFSATLFQPNPTLSNALVAALKRAQANQRRGCIELQNQLPPAPLTQEQSSQQQPLLAIKVELDRLIVSILDDPSVSRVMREASFSSAQVKSNLEEESAMLQVLAAQHSLSSFSPAVAVPPRFFNDPFVELDLPAHTNGGSWPAQFLNQSGLGSSYKEEDVRAILEVMTRKQGRRSNPVVVSDSVSVAEASVAELMRRLERGDVLEELRGAHVLRLNLPYVHARLMTHADVDARVADLRRSIDAVAGANVAALVIYVGDIRWAGDEDYNGLEDISPAERMVSELSHLLGELAAAARGRAWIVAAASYQTYMWCKRRRTSLLESTLALQPVVVPAGAGLTLGPHDPSMEGGIITRIGQIPPLLDRASGEEESVPVLCANGYEGEASLVTTMAEGFPGWPLSDEPQTSHQGDELMELKRRWTRSCQMLHLRTTLPSDASPMPPVQEPGVAVCSGDAAVSCHQPWFGVSDQLLSGDYLKRKDQEGLMPLGEPKRRRDCNGSLDLNLYAADEEEDGGDDSLEEPVPSDLTNERENNGGAGHLDRVGQFLGDQVFEVAVAAHEVQFKL